ncbi:uncharacterized protein J3D65DRAFT_620001 [Phyllosticta citribraziliensis]|uniref:Uncharacterized protein n=1 Tax=Phyllosticta citribraziliensis TaxID=989973 RepID=A0ABR1LXF3_9PEZI
MAFWTTQARQCLRYCAQTRVEVHVDAVLHPRRVPWPPVGHFPIENATAISPVGSLPPATSAKFYIPPPPPACTPWGELGFEKGPSTRKGPLLFLFSLLSVPILMFLLLKGCCLANYLFVDLPRRKKAKQKWKDSTKGMDKKQLASHGRMAEARTQLYGYVRDCEQIVSMKEYNRRDETKFFRDLEKDNRRTQRQKELRVQTTIQGVVRHDFGPSEYFIVDLEHREKTEWTVYDTYIDNSHPTPRRAIVLTADGPSTQGASPSSPSCAAESSSSSPSSGISESFSSSSLSPSPPCSAQSSRSPSCVVPESFSSSPPSSSPSPPCSAISSSPPCCVVSESCSSSSPLLSPSCNQLSLCYPSSTVSGCSTPSTDDHGASRAVVPRTWGRTNVWTPYLTVPPSTPTGCSTPPTDDHGASRAVVRRASRNTIVGTPSLIQRPPSTVTGCSLLPTEDRGASRAIVRRASRNSIIGTPYLTVPPSTPAGSFSLPPGDHGASQAIVRRASRNSIVGTPSRTALPSTPARSFSLPMNDHGTPRALVRQPSGNSVVRTPSLNQTSSLSTIVEESSSSGASGSQRKGVPGTALAKHGSCPVCRTRNLAPPPPPLPSPCSSGSSSWSSSCSCSCSSSSSSGTPSPPLAKPPSNTPYSGSAASR